LVSKTGTDTLGTAGHELHNSGMAHHTRATGTVLYLNRTGNDGNIIDLRKDNTTVGSIGATAGVLTIGNNNSGGIIFGYNGSHTFIEPSNTSGASVDDGATLGSSSKRFRDLYLSGNVITGGGGSNNTGEIEFVADSTRARIVGGYDSGGGGYLKFHTDTTGGSDLERMRITNSGDVRFAANATGAALIKGVSGNQTNRNVGGYPQFTFVGNEGTGMRRPLTNVLAFDTSGDERMRIDSSGNVGIGSGSPTSYNSAAQNLVIKDTGNVGITIAAEGGGDSTLMFADGTGGTAGYRGRIAYSHAADRMEFHTAAAEAMRVDSLGRVGIGLTTPSEKLHVYSGTGNVPAKFESGDAYSIITFADSGTSGTVGTGAQSNDLIFYSGDAQRMRLSSGGVLIVDGVYNTTTSDAANVRVLSSGNIVRSTSSRRYKNTITDASKGLTELNNLRPVTYKGNNDGDTVFYGLIAEEVHDAGLTEFVEYNDDNEPDALRYPHMVSLCIKAIQELKTELDAAKARITELEG